MMHVLALLAAVQVVDFMPGLYAAESVEPATARVARFRRPCSIPIAPSLLTLGLRSTIPTFVHISTRCTRSFLPYT